MTARPSRRHAALAACAWSALGCLLGGPATAMAFSDPIHFGLPPLAAGGGGRYFTGSPADGYTCKVCHAGGPEPKLDVLGLPLAGYRPTARYEISLSWPAYIEKFAAVVEITAMNGDPAGSVLLPPEGERQAAEYCEPASEAILAAVISEAPNGRRVINVPDCGSRRLRFLWSAPASDVGPVWFAGSSVWSDGEQDTEHDGVTDFRRVIASPSSAAMVSVATGGCSVSALAASNTRCAGGLLGLLAVWQLRRLGRSRRN